MSTRTTTHFPPAAPARRTGMRQRSILVASLAFWVLTLAGCGAGAGAGDAQGPSPAGPSHTSSAEQGSAAAVRIEDFHYSGDLTVKAGQQVVVTNQDSASHTLTSTTGGVFDTGTIPPGGGKKTFTAPSTPGSYPFGCAFHPDMAGTLVVK